MCIFPGARPSPGRRMTGGTRAADRGHRSRGVSAPCFAGMNRVRPRIFSFPHQGAHERKGDAGARGQTATADRRCHCARPEHPAWAPGPFAHLTPQRHSCGRTAPVEVWGRHRSDPGSCRCRRGRFRPAAAVVRNIGAAPSVRRLRPDGRLYVLFCAVARFGCCSGTGGERPGTARSSQFVTVASPSATSNGATDDFSFGGFLASQMLAARSSVTMPVDTLCMRREQFNLCQGVDVFLPAELRIKRLAHA